jgi:hypothetical protein
MIRTMLIVLEVEAEEIAGTTCSILGPVERCPIEEGEDEDERFPVVGVQKYYYSLPSYSTFCLVSN